MCVLCVCVKSIGDVNEKASLSPELLFVLIRRVHPTIQSLNISPSREYSFAGHAFQWSVAADLLRDVYHVKEVDDGVTINARTSATDVPCLEIDALCKGFVDGGPDIDVSPPSTPLDLIDKIRQDRTVPLLQLTPNSNATETKTEAKVKVQQKLNAIFLFETTLDVMPTTMHSRFPSG